jgi:hypothetical protein
VAQASVGEPDQLAPSGPAGDTEDRAQRSVPRWLWIAAIAVAILPIVVATVRAVSDHWIPVGDDAFFTIRARDVFSTRHIPLLGTWTSASLTVGRNINNPGPLFFDLLAIPVTVLGGTAGLAIGVGLLNSLTVGGIAWTAHRRGGPLLVVVAMLATTVMCWSMGSQMLFDPWQPHALLLPFLLYLFLAWSLACGDRVALPWMVFVGSLLVQTHLTYAYNVPALFLVGVAGLVLFRRRAGREVVGEEGAPVPQPGLVPVIVTTAAVGVACWAQPLAEQLFRNGNMTNLVKATSASQGRTLGFEHSFQVIAKVVSLPPFILRPSFKDAYDPAVAGTRGGPGGIGLQTLPSLGASLLSLAVLVGVLVVAALLARRAGDRPVVWAAVTGVVALAVGIYTSSSIPIGIFGVAAHQFRWLWPVGAFLLFTLLATVVRAVAQWSPQQIAARGRTLAFGFTVPIVLVAVLALPYYNAMAGPAESEWAIPVIRDIDRQMGSLKGRGPLLYDFSEIQFAEPYSTAIMAELQRRDVDFVVAADCLPCQLGPNRAYDGHNAKARILYRLGTDARKAPPGGELVAYHAGNTPAQRRELATLRQDVVDYIAAGRLRLTGEGRKLVAKQPNLHALRGDPPGRADPEAAMRASVGAFQNGLLDVRGAWKAKFERFVRLQHRLDHETIGVWIAPIEKKS